MAPNLAEAISSLAPAAFQGEAFRHVAPERNPLSGAGARTMGGRWNPPESFTTLYLALDETTTAGEFHRLAQRSGRTPDDFLPRRLYRFEVRVTGLLDLRSADSQERVGLTRDDLRADDASRCQAVGEVAHYLGLEGILAPSAVGSGFVIALYFDRLSPDSYVRELDYEEWSEVPSTGRA